MSGKSTEEVENLNISKDSLFVRLYQFIYNFTCLNYVRVDENSRKYKNILSKLNHQKEGVIMKISHCFDVFCFGIITCGKYIFRQKIQLFE